MEVPITLKTKDMKELITIQSELKAPKSQFNKFGNYKYRKAEDILEAVKPLLKQTSCTLNITDDIVMIGSRIYVKATATIKNSNNETEFAVGWAREEENKKGMDQSQVTGASSSYARKYALNGLFAIDDNADSDTTNYGEQKENNHPSQGIPTATQVATQAQAAAPMTTEQILSEALGYIARSTNKEHLTWVFENYKMLQGNQRFTSALTARRKELNIR